MTVFMVAVLVKPALVVISGTSFYRPGGGGYLQIVRSVLDINLTSSRGSPGIVSLVFRGERGHRSHHARGGGDGRGFADPVVAVVTAPYEVARGSHPNAHCGSLCGPAGTVAGAGGVQLCLVGWAGGCDVSAGLL